MTTDKELEDIELNIELIHGYKAGDKLCLQLSQFPEAKAQINNRLNRERLEAQILIETHYQQLFISLEEHAILPKYEEPAKQLLEHTEKRLTNLKKQKDLL